MTAARQRRRVTLVASRDRAAALAPLLETWADEGTVRIEAGAAQPDLSELADDSDAVLVIGDRNRAPRTVLPGTVLRSASGRIVPAGWLPDTGPEALRRFATCAAAVHARARSSRRTLAVLSQRHSRFGALADKVVRLVEEERSDVKACRWTAYDVHRDDLAIRLSRGPALGVYLGHGRSIGWVGYAGLRARHIGQQVDPAWLPAGAVLSLTCKTASRRNTGLSFAESIPLNGVAAATLGAVGPTLHTDNARWAVRIVRILPRVETVGELIAEVAAVDPAAGTFRLVGDPTAPLLDAPNFTSD